MGSLARDILQTLALTTLADWAATLTLIFGGCCSNALSLELITSQHPAAGSLITFAQFALISLFGLRKHLTFSPPPIARTALLDRVTHDVFALKTSRPGKCLHLRVAVDGDGDSANSVACARFADELTERLRVMRELSGVIRSSMESLAPPASSGKPEDRMISALTKGRWVPSPASTQSMTDELLDGPGSPILSTVPDDSVLILDGQSVLDIPVPDSWWDYSIFLRTDSSRKHSRAKLASLVVDVIDHDQFGIQESRPYNILPRFKATRIPLRGYLIQVFLYYLTSLLNNAAFAYHIPMAAHIIFRSGGLVMNMLMGWLITNRRYTKTQVVSVLLVTAGVALTTISSMQAKPRRPHSATTNSTASATAAAPSLASYVTGIALLTLALVLSSALGLTQDRVTARYGRGHWEESMFYLHALALPMFAFVGPDLASQVRAANAGPRMEIGIGSLLQPSAAYSAAYNAQSVNSQLVMDSQPQVPPLPLLHPRGPSLAIPAFYVPLLLNVLTQLLCTTGVHRLTSRVNSLTLTLVLVVRKAVSLGVSVLLLGGSRGNVYLWAGAASVLLGTVGYTLGGASPKQKVKEE